MPLRRFLVLFGLCSLLAPVSAAPIPAARKPKVEVVFCLDTTGSMGGLIEGAKQKIWAICNQIADGKPLPDLKVGLVAYRDRGDEYVTRVFDLSDDLDAIHGHLKKFVAAGGGDGPESVNQALDDAVNKIKWSGDKKTLKIIFLVGDAPPHMDYKDDIKYPDTCKKAVGKNIIINSIQCGGDRNCTVVWKDVALKSDGSFVAIPQNGGVQVVATPFDTKLSALNTELGKTVLVWGGTAKREADGKKNEALRQLSDASAASRVAYQAKNAQVASYCLLDCIEQKKVKLEDLKPEDLPDELKKLKPQEQKEYLARVKSRRGELNKQVLELDRKRADYIEQKRKEEAKKGTAGFDNQVLQVLRNQAKKYDIGY